MAGLLAAVRAKLSNIRDQWDDRRSRQRSIRLMKERGYSVVSLRDELPVEHRTAIEDMVSGDRLEDFEALFRDARAADIILPNARPLHDALTFCVMPDFDQSESDLGAKLAPFHRAFERRPSPSTAGLYATMLQSAASAARGYDFVDAVGEEQWQNHFELNRQARAILDQTAHQAGDDLLWADADYSLGLDHDDIQVHEFHAKFDRLWSMNRWSLPLLASRGIHLLPRWVGEDEHDVEKFARHAISVTEERFGCGAYAYVYQALANVGSLDIEDTLCDRALLRQGFEDLAARYPAQSVLNRYANTMAWAEMDEVALELFDARITAIVPEVWTGNTEQDQIDDAMGALHLGTLSRDESAED